MPMALREIIAAVGLLVFCGLYTWATFHIPDRTIPNTPGPSFFPFVIITLIAVLSVAMLFKGLGGMRSGDAGPLQVAYARLPILMLAAFMVFLVVLPWAGFLVSGIVFFAVLMTLYGSRSPVRIALWSLGLPIVFYLIFTEIFQILLPVGPWGF